MPVKLKRAYEPPSPDDGERYLVERLWPRGVKKQALSLSGWPRQLAPSSELRKWYGHAPERWPEFTQRYRAELADPEKQQALSELAEKAGHESVTLVYAARDSERNSAVVLKDELERLAGTREQGSEAGRSKEA